MPPSPAQRLTADQIAIVSKWILQGAKDLTCDENAGSCDTTAVSYSTFISPIISTYCLGCHSGGSPSGNLKLTSYSDVHAIALNGKLVGSMSWANGYKAMPQGTAKLSDCKINKFKAWINHGAPNN
jgi:cytochrome c5